MQYVYRFEHNTYFKGTAGIKDIIPVEVSEFWYGVLTALDRAERNNERRETRRHQSYETLEQADDYLIPPQLADAEKNPENALLTEEERQVYFALYDKILRRTGILTHKQFTAFTCRALCDMSFKDAAYHMRFECGTQITEQGAKKHYYNAIKKLRKLFRKEYEKLKNFLKTGYF